MAKRVITKKPAAKKISVKKTVKPAVKKWVYLFEEVGKAEKYAGSWEGTVRAGSPKTGKAWPWVFLARATLVLQ